MVDGRFPSALNGVQPRVMAPDTGSADAILAHAARSGSSDGLSAVEIEVDDDTGAVTIRDASQVDGEAAPPKPSAFDDNLVEVIGAEACGVIAEDTLRALSPRDAG